MAGERHPTDALVAELVGLYDTNVRRLEGIVAAGLRRGLDPDRLGTAQQRPGDATAAYRRRQLDQARAVLEELRRQGRAAGPILIGRAYGSGLVSTDRVLGRATPRGRVRATAEFGRIHTRAVEALAGNLSGALEEAAARAASNVELVFERADALEGALPASGRIDGVPFLGRRVDDPYRRVALETVTGGVIGLDTRRQVSRGLARRLITQGITDAVTGFVDRAGKRWSLGAYAAMVARTTTREAMTAGTANRLREHGLDLVTITSHPHLADECSPYDGQTFSLDGATPGHRVLDRRPPFHPNCRHVLAPAGANLDDFEAELEAWATSAGVDLPPAPPPPAPTPRPRPPAPRRARPAAPARTPPDVADAAATAAAELVERRRVADTLNYAGTAAYRERIEAALERTARGIENVHAFPPGRRVIDLKDGPGSDQALGSLSIIPGLGPQRITLNRGLFDRDLTRPAAEPVETFTHELGHYLDTLLAPQGRDYLTARQRGRVFEWDDDDDDVAALRDALEESQAVRDLRQMRQTRRATVVGEDGHPATVSLPPSFLKFIDYLLDPRELFARAYAQHIATGGGDVDLLRLILSRAGPQVNTVAAQWDSRDFAAVSDALERLIRNKGLKD